MEKQVNILKKNTKYFSLSAGIISEFIPEKDH